jgi:hypothetical protein
MARKHNRKSVIKRSTLWGGILGVFILGVLPAEAETVTLVTYYPEPAGAFDTLFLTPDSGSLGIPCEVGTVAFNQQGRLMICENSGTGTGDWYEGTIWTWSQMYNNVYLSYVASGSTPWTVGIGTDTPDFRLHIDGDSGILAQGTFGSGRDLLTNGAGTRLIWYPKKAAFRAGHVVGDGWDNDNIGLYSFSVGRSATAPAQVATSWGFEILAGGIASVGGGLRATVHGAFATAIGTDVTASGIASTALGIGGQTQQDYGTVFGVETEAGDYYAAAFGAQASALGRADTAFGFQTTANNNWSLAMGDNTTTLGQSSVAMGARTSAGGEDTINLGGVDYTCGGSWAAGYESEAAGFLSVATGYQSKARNHLSVAMGHISEANGRFSVAMGTLARTQGHHSVALGRGVIASAQSTTVLGSFNTDLGGDPGAWNDNEPVFILGNGTGAASRHNAVVVLKNGNVGIGVDAPTSVLSVDGLPEHADNTAAAAAGLTPGAVYRTGDILKIVH